MNIEDRDFNRLRAYMGDNFGINLEKKRVLIEGRLSNTILADGFDNFHDYLEDIFADKTGTKINTLITKLTTNYTYFMREEGHYNFLEKVALPEWTKKIRDYDLRVWSAGCSSGEEAYTIAIILDEFFGTAKKTWDTTVLATDISTRVLNIASKGIYPETSLERLSTVVRSKYFAKVSEGQWKVSDNLAKEIVFNQFNLMDSFSRFRKKFHIIFCRNVMIYFDNPTKASLARKFYDALEVGGYLFVGFSETLQGLNSGFEQVSPAIYRKGK